MFDTNAECHKCGFRTTIPAHMVDPGSSNGPLGRCPRCGAILHVARKELQFATLQIVLPFVGVILGSVLGLFLGDWKQYGFWGLMLGLMVPLISRIKKIFP
jgi:hypothetical protein